ncbi:Myc-type, basic helix-loop-helix domain-containing protein [Radiomyces spectabilis]|uniref:Myc-type, basic helix-loop-helix domain-containing protein n=1 Tax=Radiomyces spectabilis TaxID=64574 RepID=UPI00222004EE|nr:Myc-type, basic helix-loop-helix domain-containing protein [Radiomyces spectabilis]KAI8372989.1 Myc-type, basic helix-loop-helix domain-containing protein [Radiomyces spectabilis]
MEFYHTEFLEYSKETYEKKMDAKRNKRKRSSQQQQSGSETNDEGVSKKKKTSSDDKSDSDGELDDEEDNDNRGLSNAEIRRQIHIQSEQKRRAQIKDGFDELRKHLPGCNNKKMSKAALLTRTVQQIQHLKSMQTELLSEVERLVQENETLKKFQHGVLQRQAMEKMYTF